ncbi:hypothetical protein [Parasitella parasitica]|uniref:Protein Zds1 C-terminal domain-containing protein n=1 Tax=Parasitella parasitica TaxID=35722 RepID=A0A0B7NHW6_9FUNG|nr:hypothetical protein [Parasitella parasitica]
MNGDFSEESSGYDLYAALLLSNMLEAEQDMSENREEEPSPTLQKNEQEDAIHDVIWVPADKHPEIAPDEFTNFIQTHGANTPTRRASSLRRRKSFLSQSLSQDDGYNDDDEEEERVELNRTLSEKKRIFLQKVLTENQQLKDLTLNTQVFDRNSTANDDSRIIAPRADRSLLRRSAFSARGRSRKVIGSLDDRQQAMRRRSASQRKASLKDDIASVHSISTKRSWDRLEGVSLFDQPVNMSEWIDLGSASLESDNSQRGILSRVHDAESQLLSHSNTSDDNQHLQQQDTKEQDVVNGDLPPPLASSPEKEVDKSPVEEGYHVDTTGNEKDLQAPAEPSSSIAATPKMKRPSMIRSGTETNKIPTTTPTAKSERRTSWLSGLFNDKKTSKNSGKKDPVSAAMISNSTSSPISGLASLFSRSLSMKSNTNAPQSGKIKSKNKISNTNTTSTITSTTTTTITTNINTHILDTTKPTTLPSNTTSNNTLLNNKKKRSSRLEIPPPSERTFFNSNRLPLHVERAIYRLSHLKLADPRRPLQQQVLISNLMFWYLSIQQNDFQHAAEQRVETESPPVLDTQQKKVGKMSRLILSAKKRRNEVAQFVQAYPLSGTHHDISTSSSSASSMTTSSSSTTSLTSNGTMTRPFLKQSNVQFSLPQIPTHQHAINVNKEEEEEDDLPLSHYKN